MKGHAIIGFNHGVLGLPENPGLGPGLFRQNTSAYALGVLTPKASPPGWVFSQAQHPMIKTYKILQKPVPQAGFSAKPIIPWLKPIIKCGGKLLIHSQTSTVQPLKFGNGLVISSHTLLGMWLLFLSYDVSLRPSVEYLPVTPFFVI